MMYHFMLGLRGCSAASPVPSGGSADAIPAVVLASFLISSTIFVRPISSAGTSFPLRCASAEELQQVAEAELNQFVDDFKECSKDEDCDHHHRRGCLNFLATGVVDLLHLT